MAACQAPHKTLTNLHVRNGLTLLAIRHVSLPTTDMQSHGCLASAHQALTSLHMYCIYCHFLLGKCVCIAWSREVLTSDVPQAGREIVAATEKGGRCGEVGSTHLCNILS